jgi:hypothetical protein
MTFSAEFRCYIGSQTLAPWPMALAGLLPLWPTALGHNAVAQGARPLMPWGTVLCQSHTKGAFGSAPTPAVAAPAVVVLVEWILRGSWIRFVETFGKTTSPGCVKVEKSIIPLSFFSLLFFSFLIFPLLFFTSIIVILSFLIFSLSLSSPYHLLKGPCDA